jgi:hypothetical protein
VTQDWPIGAEQGEKVLGLFNFYIISLLIVDQKGHGAHLLGG